MTHSAGFSVGQRVQIYPGSSDVRFGTIVDDFGDLSGYAVTVLGTRVVEPSRRWAITLDDGGLVFVDTDDMRAN